MNKDLIAINEEINHLKTAPSNIEKYERLGVLYLCKEYIEKSLKTNKSTVIDILDDKIEQIGARATISKLEPILSQHIKDLEMIAPTISGAFIKKLKEI